jgi:alkylhydroperoxidase/carboxymuconolactone decarboxylase family protein YurZ
LRKLYVNRRELFGVKIGDYMSGNPLDSYTKIDPELLKTFENVQNLAFSKGELPQKIKYLIAMAIDAEHGSVQGTIVLGKKAIAVGAAKEEVIEALRVAYYIGGTSALFTSAMALQILFK